MKLPKFNFFTKKTINSHICKDENCHKELWKQMDKTFSKMNETFDEMEKIFEKIT